MHGWADLFVAVLRHEIACGLGKAVREAGTDSLRQEHRRAVVRQSSAAFWPSTCMRDPRFDRPVPGGFSR